MDWRNVTYNNPLKTKQNGRSYNLRKQTVLAFLFQGTSLLLSFLVIPVSLDFLNPELYGIWITLLSMMSWITIMDLGIGFGLRNKLSEAFAKNDNILAKKYISTAYMILGLILIILLLIVFFVIQILPWNNIFNTSILPNHKFATIVTITIIGVFFVFLFGLVNQVLHALQKSAFASFHPILLNLIFICILKGSHVYKDDLLYLSSVYVGSSMLSIILVSIYVYSKHSYLIPNWKFYDSEKVKPILKLSAEFFLIQIAVVVIFNSDNIIISQVLGPKEVTGYQMTRQIFGVLSMFSALIMSPLWSTYTEAYIRGDLTWIKKQIKKLVLLMIPLLIGVVIVAINFQYIIMFWIKKNLDISNLLIISMGIYTIVAVWNNIFAAFLNGISRTREQLYTAIIASVINIPLSIYLAKDMSLGSAGVIIGTTLSLLIFAIIGPLIVYIVLKKNEKVSIS